MTTPAGVERFSSPFANRTTTAPSAFTVLQVPFLYRTSRRPPSLGGAQPPWARCETGGNVTETIDLTADDADVVDVDRYIIEVLLTKVVAIKNEPGGERRVEIAEPVRFVVKAEPDAEPAAASQPNLLPGLEEQRPPAAESLCAESASASSLEDGPRSRQTHHHSTTAARMHVEDAEDRDATAGAQRVRVAELDDARVDDAAGGPAHKRLKAGAAAAQSGGDFTRRVPRRAPLADPLAAPRTATASLARAAGQQMKRKNSRYPYDMPAVIELAIEL
mmetsp:Transcript_9213/g.31723  ORF Transcript_9213/g.31723 Transcript_9213/m.31723 type:complete len:276 (+) Transcript_9213:254-1081(+)